MVHSLIFYLRKFPLQANIVLHSRIRQTVVPSIAQCALAIEPRPKSLPKRNTRASLFARPVCGSAYLFVSSNSWTFARVLRYKANCSEPTRVDKLTRNARGKVATNARVRRTAGLVEHLNRLWCCSSRQIKATESAEFEPPRRYWFILCAIN